MQYVDQASTNTAKDISIAKLQQVLDNNYQGFSRYVPLDTILRILEREKILDSRDVTDIRNEQHEEDRIELLFKFFYNHSSVTDFLIFCQLLQKQSKRATQEFGQKMKMELTQSRS